jgi:hypothetical protein
LVHSVFFLTYSVDCLTILPHVAVADDVVTRLAGVVDDVGPFLAVLVEDVVTLLAAQVATFLSRCLTKKSSVAKVDSACQALPDGADDPLASADAVANGSAAAVDANTQQ